MKRSRNIWLKVQDLGKILLFIFGLLIGTGCVLAILIFLCIGVINFTSVAIGRPAELNDIIWYAVGGGIGSFIFLAIRLARRNNDKN